MTHDEIQALEGVELDLAVAKAMGHNPFMRDGVVHFSNQGGIGGNVMFRPSTLWADGGPIIQREQINLKCCYMDQPLAWEADMEFVSGGMMGFFKGPTPLIAAMRAYVASRQA